MFKRPVYFYGFFIILLLALTTLPLVSVSYQLDQTFDFTNETQWEEDFPGNYGGFYENEGQLLNSDTILYSESPSRFVEFTKTSVTLWAGETGSPITYIFHSANEITPKGLESISYSANFFLGSRGTFTNVKGFSNVIYENLWDDIDLIFRLAESGIKYELRIHPGGDPQQILIDVEHCDSLNIESNQMTIQCGQTEFIDEGILAYQGSSSIDVSFKEVSETRFGFSVGEYSRSELLVIDPLLYSTYVGGSAYEHIADLTIDNQGNAYVVGYTRSSNFPILNGNDSTLSGDRDAYIFKLDTSGNLVYSTFLGGSSSDEAYGVVVDSSGCAYVTGYSESSDFPTVNAYDSTLDGGSNCFIVKLNDVGNNLHISTYVNTTSTGKAITMDDMGNIYVLGGTRVFKMDSDLTEILYSFGISGSDYDSGEDLTVDSTGCAYVVGWTRSTDFPTFNAFDDTCNADDCFLFKINSTGTGLVFSTFIGGTGDEAGRNVRVDASGCIYITGQTASSNFPTLNPYFDSYNGSRDVFALKMNQTGNGLIYSTYIGGTNVDYAYGMDLDSHGCVYISVATRSSNFPVVNSYDSSWNGGTYDVVVLKLNQSGNDLLYSTFIGGSDFDHPWAMAVDDNGSAYVGIYTKSTNFPLVNAYDSSFNGDHDIAVCKLADLGDTDYDAISDYTELLLGTDRFDWDTDSDLMADGWEVFYSLDPLNNTDALDDEDGDLLTNVGEFQAGSSPINPDSDFDTIDDGSEVLVYGTSPISSDTDNDAMPDPWEILHSLDPLSDDSMDDPDVDNLENINEYTNGTLPRNNDTDSDAISDGDEIILYNTNPLLNDSDYDNMPDGWEIQYGLDPLYDDSLEDPDDDELLNIYEYGQFTSPINNDTDSDLIPDGWEVFNGINPTVHDALDDPDADGLLNIYEYYNHTLPTVYDTDADFLGDGLEVNVYETDPLNNDTDSDQMPDGWEVSFGLNPLEDDAQENPDGDAYNNLEEYLNGTNPIVADTPTTTASTSTTSTSTSTSSTGGIQPTEDSSLVIFIAIVGVGIAAVVIIVLVIVKKKGVA